MTRREASLVGGFFMALGAAGLAIHLYELVTMGASPSTSSLLRASLSDLLIWIFGIPGGHIAFSAIFALISAGILALGLNAWRQRH